MLKRQVPRYALVGLLQLVLDAALFVVLTAAGLPTALANVLSRLAGAMVGFAANGRYTFTTDEHPWSARRSLPRFIVTWALLTLFGTLAVMWIGHHGSLALAWLLKPLVDLLLAATAFLVSRHWIYR